MIYLDIFRYCIHNLLKPLFKCLELPPKYTYATKGSRRVKLETNGGEMARMSAAFTAAADGTKLPILVSINLDIVSR